MLNAVLFGEGIINDAVAIILFRTVSELKLDSGSGFTYSVFYPVSELSPQWSLTFAICSSSALVSVFYLVLVLVTYSR